MPLAIPELLPTYLPHFPFIIKKNVYGGLLSYKDASAVNFIDIISHFSTYKFTKCLSGSKPNFVTVVHFIGKPSTFGVDLSFLSVNK